MWLGLVALNIGDFGKMMGLGGVYIGYFGGNSGYFAGKR
jgi:hypothetical protein